MDVRSGVKPTQRRVAGAPETQTETYYRDALPFAPDIAPAAILPTGDKRTTEECASQGYLSSPQIIEGVVSTGRRLTIYSRARGLVR